MTRSTTTTLLPTGIPGLDRVLHGGLPAERLFLVQGTPGTGKTTLALQFLLEGARRKEPCLYVTLSESEDEVEAVARSHGWTLDGIKIFDLSRIENQRTEEQDNSLFNPADIELKETTQPLLDAIAELKPARVVFDSLSELRMLATSALRYRRRVLALKQHLSRFRATTLFLDDGTSDPNGDLQLQSLAHGVISLEARTPAYGRERRQLQIVKMRGLPVIGGHHDIVIERGGVRVFPRIVALSGAPADKLAAEKAAADKTAVEKAQPLLVSGVKAMDDLVGGGLQRGHSTLIMGPSGSGKSLVASLYAHAAAARGEHVALFLFEESRETYLARCQGLGIDMRRFVEEGRVTMRNIDPAELSPQEFSHAVVDAADAGARIVVIDSLNGYLNAMSEEHALSLQLHELLAVLGARGVSTFLVMVQTGMFEVQSPIEISYIADSVFLLRFFESGGRVRKAISVMKKRAGVHETTIRELFLSPGEVQVGPALVDFDGVLTGAPRFAGQKRDLLEASK